MQSRQIRVVALAIAGTALLGFATMIGAAQAPATPPTPAKVAPTPTKAAPTTSPEIVAQGMKAYGGLDCNTCHLLSGQGTAIGPDLSHIGATWTQVKLRTLIRHPKQLDPKGWMPAYDKKKIAANQLNALTAYLASLK
jgi:cytochrome c2